MNDWFSRRTKEHLRKLKSFEAAMRHWMVAYRWLEEGERRFRLQTEVVRDSYPFTGGCEGCLPFLLLHTFLS